MEKTYTDIFKIIKESKKNKSSNNIFKCDNLKINNLTNKFKKIGEVIYKVYIHNDLQLSINNSDKICELVTLIDYKILGSLSDFIVIDSSVKKLPINSFPFIDNYHDIVERYIILYQNDINIIKETSLSSNESVIFIRINGNKSNDEIKNIINLLK